MPYESPPNVLPPTPFPDTIAGRGSHRVNLVVEDVRDVDQALADRDSFHAPEIGLRPRWPARSDPDGPLKPLCGSLRSLALSVQGGEPTIFSHYPTPPYADACDEDSRSSSLRKTIPRCVRKSPHCREPYKSSGSRLPTTACAH